MIVSFPYFFNIFLILSNIIVFLLRLLDPRSAYSVTKRLNKVSRQCVLLGSEHISVKGSTIIEASTLRGDMAPIDIGKFCVIAAHSHLQPSPTDIDSINTNSNIDNDHENDDQEDWSEWTCEQDAPALPPHSDQPPSHSPVPSYLPMTLGDYIIIEEYANIEASSIGSWCLIGHHAVVVSKY
jgi:carbonic anhydrase/acetyltransferase-like protein (isoleucine patch superfamily)